LPVCLLEPVWVQFSALLPERPRFSPTHPLGCHRERIADRVVFEHVIAALVHGSGYERIASAGCSDGTIRRRLKEWAAAGLSEQVHALALHAYDRMIGLELDDLAVDGCITRAPSGGEVAGRSPVDRGKGGLKRSVATEGTGLPLHLVSAGANRHDAPPQVALLLSVALRFASRSPGVIGAAPPRWGQGSEAGDSRQQHAQRRSVGE
jgi:hypothetical protein